MHTWRSKKLICKAETPHSVLHFVMVRPLLIKLITGDFRDSHALKVMLHGTIRNDDF